MYRESDSVKRHNGVVTNVTAEHKVTQDYMSKRGPKVNITDI